MKDLREKRHINGVNNDLSDEDNDISNVRVNVNKDSRNDGQSHRDSDNKQGTR